MLPALALSASFALADSQHLTPDEKSQLQQQLQEIENQIAQYQQQISQIQGEKKTLQNKINQLKKQQAAITLQIKATSLQITVLGSQISETQKRIDDNTAKISKLKKQISEMIKLVAQQDDISLLDVMLSQDNLADVFSELENYSEISDRLKTLLDDTAIANQDLQQDKQEFADQQDDANNLLAIQSLQQQQLASSMNEQSIVLAETKGKEATYQAVLNDTQKKAAEIRSRLYPLLDVSHQISFGEAVSIAQYAQGLTGVRAAFLLAILTQESNLGKNVGTCNRPGDPAEKSYKAIMKPDRDIPPFLQITSELGLDPETTPVSCPMRNKDGSRLGWGGAMGPAQFIPSTWMGYKDQVGAITGKAANPWDIRDAFVGAAIKLKAAGADSPSGEWAAAMRYFSGGTNTKYRFYGDNVVAMANRYQNDIDALNQ